MWDMKANEANEANEAKEEGLAFRNLGRLHLGGRGIGWERQDVIGFRDSTLELGEFASHVQLETLRCM